MAEIIGRENKFTVHVSSKQSKGRDFHMVKEVLHYDDGSTERGLKFIYDFQRPFYITKEPFRNHKQKKEYEDLAKVNKFMTTESDLVKNVGTRLGMVPSRVKSKRDILMNPYVYWLDITSSSILKAAYNQKYPECVTPYTYAALDIESDVDTKDLTIITVGMGAKLYTAIWTGYLKETKDIQQKLKDLYVKHTPDGTPKKFDNADVEYEFMDNPLDMIEAAFKKLHEWQPDFCGIWNIDYDMPFILDILKSYDFDPANIICDPRVPKQYRYFKYRKGIEVKRKEDGTESSLKPHKRWSYVIATSSFFMIDAMAAYNFVRVGQANVPGGYGLDNIVKKHTKIGGKLKFKDVGAEPGSVDWHREMSKRFPMEYIIYNQWDVMAMLVLDDKTKDLESSVPVLSDITDFGSFNSSPKKVVDDLHFFYLKHGKVIGTKDPNVDNNPILGRNDWVVTLPANKLIENGLAVWKGAPQEMTSLRGFVFDIDAVSSYPKNIEASNMSKQTTKNEIVSIDGMTKDIFLYENIDLIGGGEVNAIKYCNTMMDFPALEEF